MVYGIVQQHGGHITCDSVPGKGTTFRIYFPVVPSEQEENGEQDSSMPTGGSETVFLVDDDEVVIEVGSKVLTRIGYTVLTATTGKEALEIYRKHQTEISLVILDKVMPEMGGIQCFQELVKINPNVRVIVSTGLLASGTVKDAADLGARGFVQKPWDAKTFLHMVRKVLDEG
jgi:DNA-binding NtrC family response regulator